MPCAVSQLLPGEPAWRPIFTRATGSWRSAITRAIDGAPLRFRDLMSSVVLGNLKEGVRFQIERDGVADPFWVVVHPAERSAERLSPTIGVESPRLDAIVGQTTRAEGQSHRELGRIQGGRQDRGGRRRAGRRLRHVGSPIGSSSQRYAPRQRRTPTGSRRRQTGSGGRAG